MLLFGGSFLVLSGPGLEALFFAALAGGLAGAARGEIRGKEESRVRVAWLIRFIPFFLEASIRGGVDVAWRAFAPSLPIDPGFVEWELRLESGGPAAAFFAAVISLVPGTLCVRHEEGILLVHLLSKGEAAMEALGELERRVGLIFGENVGEQNA